MKVFFPHIYLFIYLFIFTWKNNNNNKKNISGRKRIKRLQQISMHQIHYYCLLCCQTQISQFVGQIYICSRLGSNRYFICKYARCAQVALIEKNIKIFNQSLILLQNFKKANLTSGAGSEPRKIGALTIQKDVLTHHK